MMKLFLFSMSDSSYDAVRRTGWSNNMHSGKGESTIIIHSVHAREGTPNVGNFIILHTLKHKSCMQEDPEGIRLCSNSYFMLHLTCWKAFRKLWFWHCQCVLVSFYAVQPTQWREWAVCGEERCISAVAQTKMPTSRWALGSRKIQIVGNSWKCNVSNIYFWVIWFDWILHNIITEIHIIIFPVLQSQVSLLYSRVSWLCAHDLLIWFIF